MQIHHTWSNREEIRTRRSLYAHCNRKSRERQQEMNSLTELETLGLGQTATIFIQVQHGRGQHTINLEEEHFDHMLMVKHLLSNDTTLN